MQIYCESITLSALWLSFKIVRAISVPLSCPLSAISYVADCPDRKSTWDLRAIQKNCSQFESYYNCTNSAYHCYRTTNLSTIEICAPAVLISEGYCPSFSLAESRVTEQVCNPINNFSCSSNKSWSNTFWKYQGCYRKSSIKDLIYNFDATKKKMELYFSTTVVLSVIMVAMAFSLLFMSIKLKCRSATCCINKEESTPQQNQRTGTSNNNTYDEQQSVNEPTSSMELEILERKNSENEANIFLSNNIENSKRVFVSPSLSRRECDDYVPLINFVTEEHLLKKKTIKDPKETIYIYLVGQTGEGKSSTGNTILGEEAFEKGMSCGQVTHNFNSRQKYRFGRSVHVIDCPGCEDLSVLHTLKRLIAFNSNEEQVIVLVLRVKRFSHMDENFITIFKNYFCDDINERLIVLFTGRDELIRNGIDLDLYLQFVPSVIKDIVRNCNRSLSFNNSAPFHERESQAEELIYAINEKTIRTEDHLFTFF